MHYLVYEVYLRYKEHTVQVVQYNQEQKKRNRVIKKSSNPLIPQNGGLEFKLDLDEREKSFRQKKKQFLIRLTS